VPQQERDLLFARYRVEGLDVTGLVRKPTRFVTP